MRLVQNLHCKLSRLAAVPLPLKYWSSRPRVFCRTATLKMFGKFTGKNLWWRSIFVKLQAKGLQLYENRSPPPLLSYEFSENVQNSSSTEHMWISRIFPAFKISFTIVINLVSSLSKSSSLLIRFSLAKSIRSNLPFREDI